MINNNINNINLYKDFLLDHYKNPRNYGLLDSCDIYTIHRNPSCGDNIEFYLDFDKNSIKNIKFKGQGCVISQATASILTDNIKNKILSEILEFDYNFINNLIGINLGPNRIKCALLSLEALHASIIKYINNNK